MSKISPIEKNLADTIQSELASDRLAQLVQTLKVAKLPDDVLSCALQAGITNNGHDFSVVAQELVTGLKSRLQRNSFKDNAMRQTNRRKLLESFDYAANNWLAEIEQLIRYYDINVRTVKNYRQKLLAQKTRSLSHDKWGNVNYDAWNNVMIDFARDHFIGPDRSLSLETALPEVRMHFLGIQAQDLSGRFVWLELELLQAKDRNLDSSSDSLSKHQKGSEFELHIKTVLQNAVPSAIVEMTPASGDQGADLIFNTANAKIVIQAKRYTGTVGNAAVQEVHAARGFYGATAAVVVTNSTYTKSARDLAAELGVALLHEDEIATIFAQAFT